MTDDIRAGVISYEATYQVRPFSDTRSGVISFESIRFNLRFLKEVAVIMAK